MLIMNSISLQSNSLISLIAADDLSDRWWAPVSQSVSQWFDIWQHSTGWLIIRPFYSHRRFIEWNILVNEIATNKPHTLIHHHKMCSVFFSLSLSRFKSFMAQFITLNIIKFPNVKRHKWIATATLFSWLHFGKLFTTSVEGSLRFKNEKPNFPTEIMIGQAGGLLPRLLNNECIHKTYQPNNNHSESSPQSSYNEIRWQLTTYHVY